MKTRLLRTQKAQKGTLVTINSIDQLKKFENDFNREIEGMSDSRKRKFQAAKEEMERIVSSGGSFDIYNDGTFKFKKSDDQSTDSFGLTKNNVEIGGRLANRRGKNKESLFIGMLAQKAANNKGFFNVTPSVKSEIEKKPAGFGEENLPSLNLPDTLETNESKAKSLEQWRADYEKSTGESWDDLVKGKDFMGRRVFNKGFWTFLGDELAKGIVISDEGFIYEDGSKYFV